MVSVGLSSSAQLGSLIVYSLSGTAALAGIPTAIVHLAMAGIGYPAGRFMDRRGRRPGLVAGFVFAVLGAAAIAATVTTAHFAGYLVSMVLFSAGAGIGMLSRGIVGDMYPPDRRGAAVGIVVAGGLLGGVIGPSMVLSGDRLARAIGANPLAVPWMFVCMAFALAAAAVFRLRPDPKDRKPFARVLPRCAT